MSIEIPSDLSVQSHRGEDAYLRALLKQSEGQKIKVRSEIVGWLQELRQRAAYDVAQQQIPTRRDEEWRFTDLSELSAANFERSQPTSLPAEAIAPFILPEAKHSRLVFVNGFYDPDLSDLSALPEGVFAGNLTQLPLEASYGAIEYIAHQEGAREVFTALNTAGFPDVAIIWPKRNVIVETPIHLLFLTAQSDRPIFSQPRGLIVAETGASLALIEQYAGTAQNCAAEGENAPYLNNTVVEIFAGANARIEHTRYQHESANGFHIGKTAASQGRNSYYLCHAVTLGAKLSRHNLEIWQKGEQTETELQGLTAIARQQTADTHSAIHLNHPHGTANQLHKCIADDSAHAIFNGKVIVPKPAQLTNAAQLNRNLLLSPSARVDTKPELQITADNVKCTHGATISQIDTDELFYLQTRGIDADRARNLLLDAFAAEILDSLAIASLRSRLAQCVACRT
ncbi:MAG: Fe-S cluster assembly protein SufD [Cyanobacteriota bacterium]|nr:Fe-S cluster assembly protein SufD [Cyanobacteriota bacterium]